MVRGARSTLFLVVVLVGLVAYIYFVDRNRPVGDTEALDTVFAELEADDIEEVEIKAEDGETTRLRRMDGTWQIVEPMETAADAEELTSITSSLATMEIQRVVEENAPDLMRFGLEPARLEIGVRAAGEEEMQRLLIGNRTPTESDLYARLADSRRVFLISSFLDDTFNKNTFALRDKAILKFDRDAAETITMTRGSTTLEFAKRDGEWDIRQPIDARGDYGVVQSVVERLASAEMQRIADPDPEDLGEYGLDDPAATIVVGTGSAQATLTLGRTEDALVYAKDSSRPMVFAVAPTIETDLFKELEDFRRKDLFDSRSFTATRVEITRDGNMVTFEKTTKDDMDVWQRAGAGTVETATMDDLLGQLTGLRAASFEPARHPSLKSPVLTATIHFSEDRMETVTFGRAGDTVYASRSDEPGTATIDTAAFDAAVKALEAATP